MGIPYPGRVQTTLPPSRSVLQVPTGNSLIVVGFILPLANIPLLGLDAVHVFFL